MDEQTSFSPNDPIDRADRRIVWILRIVLAAFAITVVVLLAMAMAGAGWGTWATLGTILLVTLVIIGLVIGFVFLSS